jgi:mersacidin/lichenicidin family type 2 lantibiotic
MSHVRTIRAWKDEDFRLSLSDAERASLPEHPAGPIELSDTELGAVGGGIFRTFKACSIFCVPTALCTPGPYCPF